MSEQSERISTAPDEAAKQIPNGRAFQKRGNRPDPQWVRGECPKCREDLVSNLYYIGGKGYILCWECWASLGADPTCDYRKVL